MSSKFSNKTLAAVFGILVLVVLFIFVFDTGKNERTFRDELVDIDTSAVTEIKIYPKSENGSEIRLFIDDDKWNVTLPGGKTVSAPESKIKNLFSQLLSIKPKRLAARGEKKWSEYEVDSSGTVVQVFEGGSKALDLVIGRFAFQQPRSMSTFVRLNNDTDVYEVDGFLSATFNQDANSFRDNVIIKSDHEKWERLVYNYPGDSSFQLQKLDDKWFVNDEPVDSAATVRYLRSIQRLTSTNFVDDVNEEQLISPKYSLTIESPDSDRIVVEGFQVDSLYLIRSTMNEESVFDASKNGLGDKVFVGPGKFLSSGK